MAEDTIVAPLSQGWGYGVIIGIGVAFAIAMMGITHLLYKYAHEDNSHFETYSTAGRSVGVGLTATAVISSWAWSTALLSSSIVTVRFGVGGAFWYGAGCIVQICFFALLAIQSKLKTPNAHTILEVVKVRYGTIAHIVYMTLCLINNLIAVVNMLLGASASISALTGMHVVASIFLLPLGVCLYTISGGLRATFVTDWAHTVALFVIVVYLSLKILTSAEVGSLGELWNTVREAGVESPVAGNYNGSYLTMRSPSAVEFGILHTLGDFGLVMMDSSYWQKAYSADVAAAVPGYMLGGLIYFGLPWCLGTVVGLGSLALQKSPSWPAFGRALTTSELDAGLVLPYSGMAVAGKAGAVAVVLVVFMAVTSTMSAELIAVSSILSSDVYRTYVKREASGREIMRVSHVACVGFALVGCAVSVAVYYAGVSLTWTGYFLGVITCPGMITMPLTVLWKGQTKMAAIVSPILGLAGGLATWIMTAKHYGGGEISVATTGELLPCLWGSVVSTIVPGISTVIVSTMSGESPFAWETLEEMQLVEDDMSMGSSLGGEEEKEGGKEEEDDDDDDDDDERLKEISAEEEKAQSLACRRKEEEKKYMERMKIVSGIAGVITFVVVWIIWPFSMYGAKYEFGKEFFGGWVVVGEMWMVVGLVVILVLPPMNGRKQLRQIAEGVIGK